jgi:hypothetical protein
MKSFKFFFLSSFFITCVFGNVFGVKKITSATKKKIEKDSIVFFELLTKEQQVLFDEPAKKTILNLYVKCKENDAEAIEKIVKAFKKEEKSSGFVAAVLLFAINRKDSVVGKNLLEKQILRKFIFDSLKNNDQVALKLLRYAIDLGTDKCAFIILKELFSRIFLIDEDNEELPEDGLEDQISRFFRKDDCDIQMQFLYGVASEKKARDLVKKIRLLGGKYDLSFDLVPTVKKAVSNDKLSAKERRLLEEDYLDLGPRDLEEEFLDEVEKAGIVY